MPVQITFNKKSFSITSLPNTLKGMKVEIFRGLNKLLPTKDFDIKMSFMNHSRRLESVLVSTETQYKSLLKRIPNNTSHLTIDVIPSYTSEEKRDVVTIEDEDTHSVYYVDFRDTKEEPRQPEEVANVKVQEEQPQKMSKIKEPISKSTKFQPQKKMATQSTSPHSRADTSQRLEFVCNNCGYRYPGRVRYHSTTIEDYDLCEKCFSEVRHPYPVIEYIDGQPTRKIEPPKYSGYQRPSTTGPFGGYGARTDRDYSNFPSYGRPKRSGGFNDFFSLF